MDTHRGEIAAVHRRARPFAFILKNSIRRTDGAPLKVSLTEDLFLHSNENQKINFETLRAGCEVEFTIDYFRRDPAHKGKPLAVHGSIVPKP